MSGPAPPPGTTGQVHRSTDEGLGGGERGKPELVRFHLFIPSLIQQLSLMCKMAPKKQPSNLAAHPHPWEEERDESISGH